MKSKFSLMWRVAVALVLVLSLGLVMTVPAYADDISASGSASLTNSTAGATGVTLTVSFTSGSTAIAGITTITTPNTVTFDLPDADVIGQVPTDGSTVTLTGGISGWTGSKSVATSTNVVTIEAQGDAGLAASTSFGIEVANITNPEVAASYDVTVATNQGNGSLTLIDTGTASFTITPAEMTHLWVEIPGTPIVGETTTVKVWSGDQYKNLVSSTISVILTATGDAGGDPVLAAEAFNLVGGEYVTTITDTTAETVTVDAYDARVTPSPLTSGWGTVEFTAGDPIKLAIVPPSQEAVAGSEAEFTLQPQDSYGNPTACTSRDVYVAVTGSAKITYVDEAISPTAAHTITGFIGAMTIRVEDTVIEAVDVSATDLSATPLTAASATISYVVGAATQIVVTPSDPITDAVVGTTVPITAQIADANGNPVAEAGVEITFAIAPSVTVTEGFVAPSLSPETAVTDATGKATTTLTLATQAGKVHQVTASDVNGYADGTSAQITTIADEAAKLSVTALDDGTDPSQNNRAPADFTAWVVITAAVQAQYGNAVAVGGREVSFSSTLGTLSAATADTGARILRRRSRHKRQC